MTQFNCGDLVRLKATREVFRVISLLEGGMVKISTAHTTLITCPEWIEIDDSSEEVLLPTLIQT